MRPARVILLYAGAVIVLGALLAAPLYWLTEPRWPFRRVFDRAILIVAVVGLWPMLRGLGIRSWAGLGYAHDVGWWRKTLTGFCAGILSLGVGVVALVLLGTRQFGSVSLSVWTALPVALVVGVIEETLFRGGIYGALRRGIPVQWAIVISSAIYSVLHFLKPKGTVIESVTWWSGFDQFAQVIRNSFQQPGAVVGSITLFLAGVILAVAFQRSGTIYLSIGLHAGWVCALKVVSGITEKAGARQWWGGGSLIDNVLVWPVLLVLLWWVNRWRPQSSPG